MSYIIGARDFADGEPSKTFLRHVFLIALREALPGILPDLWERTTALARAVLATAGTNDRPEHLLTQHGLRLAADRLVELASVAEAGPLRLRFQRRNEARAELWAELVAWATDQRLTDATASRNRWLLDVVVETVRAWSAEHAPGADRAVVCAPDRIDWKLPSATTIGDDRSTPAPEFRRRKHAVPDPGSQLGQLARDSRWLVEYVIAERARTNFAPGVARATVVQQVRAAAHIIGFELPVPLRSPAASD